MKKAMTIAILMRLMTMKVIDPMSPVRRSPAHPPAVRKDRAWCLDHRAERLAVAAERARVEQVVAGRFDKVGPRRGSDFDSREPSRPRRRFRSR